MKKYQNMPWLEKFENKEFFEINGVAYYCRDYQEKFACQLKINNKSHRTSKGVCGTITHGYGRLDENGYWKFPLIRVRKATVTVQKS